MSTDTTTSTSSSSTSSSSSTESVAATDSSSKTASTTVDDAFDYMDAVKEAYATTQPAVYAEFLETLKEVKANTIDTARVKQRVRALFRDNDRLIQAFNRFLPANDSMSVVDEPPQQQAAPATHSVVRHTYTVDGHSTDVRIYSTPSLVGDAVAAHIIRIANDAIAARGHFTVAFSGGSLPATVGAGLLKVVCADNPVGKWHIFYADERCVKLNDSESNHSAVEKHFLSKLTDATGKPTVHTIDPALIEQPAEAAKAYANEITSVVPTAALDVLLLGVGPDGHCCSLFPGHALLKETELIVASITDSPKPPPTRITLTVPTVNKGANVVFVVTGDKSDPVSKVMEGNLSGDDRLPSGRVYGTESTTWFLDTVAAAKLTESDKPSMGIIQTLKTTIAGIM